MKSVFRDLAAVAIAALLLGATTAEAQTKVKLTTDFAVNGRHAFFYVALDKGYFKAEGMDVEIVPGRGSGTTVQEVAAGIVKFGYADAGSLILARGTEGAPVKMVGVVYDSPHALVFLEKTGIKTPKDLEGRSLADTASGPMVQFFPAFAKRAGIDASKVKWVNVTSAASTTMLLSGQVDGIGQMSVGVPLLAERALPEKVTVMRYKDAGLTLYSSGIIAREDTLANEPKLVKAFMRAIQRGMVDAFADPDEAGRILHKYNRQIEAGIASKETALVKEMVMTPQAAEKGLMYIDPEKMKLTVEIVREFNPQLKPVAAEDVYASGFVEPLPAKP